MCKKTWFKSVLSIISGSDKAAYVLTGIISFLIFCMIYGFRVLNPSYTDWLLSGGDLTQHYLGWKAYSSGEWMWPPGNMNSLSYPTAVSIIYTDSIPLLAVPFKLLSPALPREFQYFGWWGAGCFVLQGVIGTRIIWNKTKDIMFSVLSGLLFTVTPVMIWRMFGHTSLAGHWLLLLAVELFVCREKFDTKQAVKRCMFLGILAGSVHLYFVPMCAFILMAYFIEKVLSSKYGWKSLSALCVYVISAAFTIAFLGGFTDILSYGSDGLGIYSLNLDALINPQGWSCILPDLPLYGDGQYEGFGYLGAGVILLLGIEAAVFLKRKNVFKTSKKISALLPVQAALFICILSCLIFALSPIVTVGSTVLADYKREGFIFDFWAIFRSTGRFIWPVIYIIMVYAAVWLRKMTVHKTALAVLFFCMLIQIYDLHEKLIQIHSKFSNVVKYESLLQDKDFWDGIGNNKKIKHIVFIDWVPRILLYSITDWAVSYDKTVSYFYFARPVPAQEYKDYVLQNLSESDLYIFADPVYSEYDMELYDLIYYKADGWYAGIYDGRGK